jgi:exopolyphosphatase/guanosine-5'-triphosphate,3'-diphosphate pyrophosphatase
VTLPDFGLPDELLCVGLTSVEAVRRAVIDVGTNSIKLLVADVADGDVRPVIEESKQSRLGQGFYNSHRLQPEPIANTAKAVAFFASKAGELSASSIRIIATSAARDAVNAGELISAIEQASRLKVEIISGDQEAKWVFQGATTDPALSREPLLLLDVGGGSSEFIVGRGDHKHFRHSFPLGTVRLLEKFPHSDPPRAEELGACRSWLREFLENEVRPKLEPALRWEAKVYSGGPAQLVGTGGTASILSRIEARLDTYDRDRMEAMRLGRERLRWQVERLWGLPLEARKQIVGLPPNRADVILNGAAIYEAIMDEFNFRELRISTRGLRFGAVLVEPA